MTREKKGKTKIKKIEKKAARQVAFSKRRRGLFSKADQLSRLCDAKLAAIIFSSAGRLYSYSTSSMKDMIAEYEMSRKKSLHQAESELLNKHYAMLCEEVAKKSRELRQLKGEGLEGLDIQQLQSLEDKTYTAFKNVRNTMQENFFMAQIKTQEQKQAAMLEENDNLRQMMTVKVPQALDLKCNGAQEVGHYCGEKPLDLPDDSSIILKLGLPCSDD